MTEMKEENARHFMEKVSKWQYVGYCDKEQAVIAFPLSPDDFNAFREKARLNGYMIPDLLVILMRDYVEGHKGDAPESFSKGADEDEEAPECCEEVGDLWRFYEDLAHEVDDLKDDVRALRRALSRLRC